MEISKLEWLGLGAGCIPGISIPTGVIKFFIYYHRESNLKEEAKRSNTEENAAKTNKIAQDVMQNMEDITNLKWCALLQVVPLFGIIGVIFEKRLLSRINFSSNENDIKSETDITVAPQIESDSQSSIQNENVIRLTDANFEATIAKGNVAVLLYGTSMISQKNRKMFHQIADEKLKGLTFCEGDIFTFSKEILESYKILDGVTRVILLFNDGVEISRMTQNLEKMGDLFNAEVSTQEKKVDEIVEEDKNDEFYSEQKNVISNL